MYKYSKKVKMLNYLLKLAKTTRIFFERLTWLWKFSWGSKVGVKHQHNNMVMEKSFGIKEDGHAYSSSLSNLFFPVKYNPSKHSKFLTNGYFITSEIWQCSCTSGMLGCLAVHSNTLALSPKKKYKWNAGENKWNSISQFPANACWHAWHKFQGAV